MCEFDVLPKLMMQGRDFGAGVIFASGYLRHFRVDATDLPDGACEHRTRRAPSPSWISRRRLYGRPLAGAVPGRPVSGVVFTAAVCALRPLTEAGLYVRFPSVEAPFSARVKFRVSDTQSDAAIVLRALFKGDIAIGGERDRLAGLAQR